MKSSLNKFTLKFFQESLEKAYNLIFRTKWTKNNTTYCLQTYSRSTGGFLVNPKRCCFASRRQATIGTVRDPFPACNSASWKLLSSLYCFWWWTQLSYCWVLSGCADVKHLHLILFGIVINFLHHSFPLSLFEGVDRWRAWRKAIWRNDDCDLYNDSSIEYPGDKLHREHCILLLHVCYLRHTHLMHGPTFLHIC